MLVFSAARLISTRTVIRQQSPKMERCDLLGLSAWNWGSLLFCSTGRPCFRLGCADPRALAAASAGMQSRLLLTLPRTHLAHL